MSETNNAPSNLTKIVFVIGKIGTASKTLDIANLTGGMGGTIFLGRGTAKNSILDLWGLEKEQEYELIMLNVPSSVLNDTINEINTIMNLEQPGNGILFALSPYCSAGIKILRQFLEDKFVNAFTDKSSCEEDIIMSDNNREFSLIISITNRGYADDTMDAAREAGAEGGIIINSRGAGFGTAEKFLGISIENEREILLNLVEKSKVNNILNAIVEKTGIKTEARGISFVLPVDFAKGVVRLDD